jgi:hypothetical protein
MANFGLGWAHRLPQEEAMHPHLTMILADQSVADLHRCAKRSRRVREVPSRPKRRFGLRPSLALRLPRAHTNLSAAR